MKDALQVMKFGGTSVGDATCIARAAEIIATASKKHSCIAVVSAMSGVTNRLIEAANRAGDGENREGVAIVDALRRQHETALSSLVRSEDTRKAVMAKIDDVLAEGRRLCEGTALLRELT